MRALALTASLCCAALTGCVTSPFPKPAPFTPPAGVALSEVPLCFASRLAARFEQVNAIVFSYKLHELTALGVASVDLKTRSFTVTCMTPLGVKLFDVVCAQGRVEGRYVHPEFAKRGGDLAQAAGTDLTRAYFDLQPPESAPYTVAGGRLVFAAADAAGVTEYRYAGGDGCLAEKVRFEQGRRQWTVEYRAYARSADGVVPTGLVIVNHQYGYRLVVATREEKR